MSLTPSREHVELQQSVRRFLAETCSNADVRRLMATDNGYDPPVWSRMVDELGLAGLIIPEQYGGSGASWFELGIVLLEMGRALYCGPFFSTVVLAATTVMESGDATAMGDLLPRIANGTIATVALTEESGRWDELGVSAQARHADGGYLLNGCKTYVIDGLIAEVLIVAARLPAGVTLFVVDGGASGISKRPLKTLDLTRKLAELNFDDVRATILGVEGDGWQILARAMDLAAVGLAAEQVGGAEAALDMAVEYAKLRVQFGQPIGAFQAIKHKCADMFLEVESAKSALYYALRAADRADEEFRAAAALAKAFCSDAYVSVTNENLQIHGGIGFTWEVSAHLYLKRARSMELYLGDSNYHHDRLAGYIGL